MGLLEIAHFREFGHFVADGSRGNGDAQFCLKAFGTDRFAGLDELLDDSRKNNLFAFAKFHCHHRALT